MVTSARPHRTGNHRRRSASGKNRALLPNFFFLLPPLACLWTWIMTYLATSLEGNYSDTNITSSRWGYHKRTGGIKTLHSHTLTFRFDAAPTARSIRTVLPFLHWTFLPFAVQHNTSSSAGEDTLFDRRFYFGALGIAVDGIYWGGQARFHNLLCPYLLSRCSRATLNVYYNLFFCDWL